MFFAIAFLFIYAGGAQLVTSLIFSIPLSRMYDRSSPKLVAGRTASKNKPRVGIWLGVWAGLGIACIMLGYQVSEGILYYQKPLSQGYRIAHGLTTFTYFFAPLPFQAVVAHLLPRKLTSQMKHWAAVHFAGFGMFAIAAILFAILLSTVLQSWDFYIPNGYNPGFPVVEAVTTYAFLLGVGLFVLSSIYRSRHALNCLVTSTDQTESRNEK